MDFSKAFDNVCHSLLVQDMRYCWMVGRINTWTASYSAGACSRRCWWSRFYLCSCGHRSLSGDCFRDERVHVVHRRPSRQPDFYCSTIHWRHNAPRGHQIQRRPKSNTHPPTPQQDFNKLAQWERCWIMAFHLDKWQSLHVPGRRDPILTAYIFHG